MSKPIDTKTVLKTLTQRGFVLVSQKGSHAKYRTNARPIRTVIVKTTKKQIPLGTFKSILAQSGLQESDFR